MTALSDKRLFERVGVMMCTYFPLPLRNVEGLLHERGTDIIHETVRLWWNRFGAMFERTLSEELGLERKVAVS